MTVDERSILRKRLCKAFGTSPLATGAIDAMMGLHDKLGDVTFHKERNQLGRMTFQVSAGPQENRQHAYRSVESYEMSMESTLKVIRELCLELIGRTK